jgi:hypothetical protein
MTTTPTTEKRIDTRYRRGAEYIGVDVRGNKHVLLCYRDCSDLIQVIRDGEVRASMKVSGSSVESYMDAIAKKAGWKHAYFGPLAYEGYDG